MRQTRLPLRRRFVAEMLDAVMAYASVPAVSKWVINEPM
jgi:hypothetical protein